MLPENYKSSARRIYSRTPTAAGQVEPTLVGVAHIAYFKIHLGAHCDETWTPVLCISLYCFLKLSVTFMAHRFCSPSTTATGAAFDW